MGRFLLAVAALCAASAASADVGDLEQRFYPASSIADDTMAQDVPLRLDLDDYLVILKGDLPSSFRSAGGYPFGEANVDNDGLTAAQSYLLSTVASSIDDVSRGIVFLNDGSGMAMLPSDIEPMPAGLAPVPEAHEWAMIAAGLGVVGFAARRRRSQAA